MASRTERLTEKLLQDRAQRAARPQAQRQRTGIDFNPYDGTWQPITGGDPVYMPKPMRRGKDGFVINCQACGKKFDSKGLAYCEACMDLPAEARKAMIPSGRECEAPGCSNVIAPTARADARYCSTACRTRASRYKNDAQLPDTAPPENVTFNQEKDEQNQRPKMDTQKTNHFAELQGDAVLSNWKPTGDGRDVPDIPDFLRR